MRIVNALLRSPIISGLCAVGAMYTTAVGDVSITQTGGTMFVLENQIIDQERQITLWCQGSPGMSVTITATSGSNPIRYIHVASEAFTGTTGNVVLTVNESGGTIPRIGEIYPVSAAPFEDGELWIGDVLISGGIGDPSSPHSRVIFADVISRVQVAGTITADLVAGPRLFGGDSTIERVRSSNGSILGDIYAPRGGIDEVYAHVDIGSSTDVVFIWAQASIQSVDAATLYADINSTSDGGSGDVWFVRARSGGFTGALAARRLESSLNPSGLSIAGDLDADLAFIQDVRDPILVSGSLPVDRSIRIGRSMIDNGTTEDGRIVLADGGLAGQVIINAGNLGTPGVWSGTVTVGSIVLGPGQSPPNQSPHYGVLSSELGGGAVGLAPFNLHLTDCDPPHGASLEFDPTTTVYLRHYGPVFWEAQSNPDPVRIF